MQEVDHGLRQNSVHIHGTQPGLCNSDRTRTELISEKNIRPTNDTTVFMFDLKNTLRNVEDRQLKRQGRQGYSY